MIGHFWYIKIQLESEAWRTKKNELTWSFTFLCKLIYELDAQGAFTRASYRAFFSCMGQLHPQHEQQSKLSCQSIVHYFSSRFSISEQHFSEECFNSFLVCLATTTGLRLSTEHLSLQDSLSTCLSVRSLPCIPANIWNSSGHLKWAQDNAVNHIGMPSCFTIAITSRMNFFQYGGVPGICLWNKYAWSSQIRFTNL